MKPSIGRIVHFVHNGVHLPAIVTKVWSDTCVNLHVFANGSDMTDSGTQTSVCSGENPVGYSWHWPERDDV